MQLLLFLGLFSYSSAQAIVYFNTLLANNKENIVFDRPVSHAIYVSGSNDDPNFLNAIFFENLGVKKSAWDLKNRKVFTNSDLLYKWPVTGRVTVTTTLSTEELKQVTGFLYISTAAQANNSEFRVYDVTRSNEIKTTQSRSLNQTIVILNSNSDSSTTFANWNQQLRQGVNIYRDVPNDIENFKKLIFANPAKSPGILIEAVDSFSIPLPVFNIIIKGSLTLKISPGTVWPNMNTVNYTCTGLMTRSGSRTILKNPTGVYNGISGFNVIGSALPDGQVQVNLNYDSQDHPYPITPSSQVSTYKVNKIVNLIEVASTGVTEYFIQYYIIQGAPANP